MWPAGPISLVPNTSTSPAHSRDEPLLPGPFPWAHSGHTPLTAFIFSQALNLWAATRQWLPQCQYLTQQMSGYLHWRSLNPQSCYIFHHLLLSCCFPCHFPVALLRKQTEVPFPLLPWIGTSQTMLIFQPLQPYLPVSFIQRQPLTYLVSHRCLYHYVRLD